MYQIFKHVGIATTSELLTYQDIERKGNFGL